MDINELLEKQSKLRASLSQHKFMLEQLDHVYSQFPDIEFKANVVSRIGSGAAIPLDYAYFREHYLIVQRNHIVVELNKVNELIDAVNTLLGKQNEK